VVDRGRLGGKGVAKEKSKGSKFGGNAWGGGGEKKIPLEGHTPVRGNAEKRKILRHAPRKRKCRQFFGKRASGRGKAKEGKISAGW